MGGYLLPSERGPLDWSRLHRDQAAARREKRRLRSAALAYRRDNLMRLLSGEPLDPPPAGVVPDYARWAADLLRDIDRARAMRPAEIAAVRPDRVPHWRACQSATAHQRLRLRGIAGGLREP